MPHLPLHELEAGLPEILCSPADGGRVELIVRRPSVDEREVLAEGHLDCDNGLAGDTWRIRPSSRMADRSPHPDMQLNVINARLATLVAGLAGPPGPTAPVAPAGPTTAVDSASPHATAAVVDRRALAGDQLYLDLDLSEANLPPGSLLRLGTAMIEVTDESHLGCAKFSARFGPDALRFVNSPMGRELRLRGLNARVVVAGTVRQGDIVTKVVRATASPSPVARGASLGLGRAK